MDRMNISENANGGINVREGSAAWRKEDLGDVFEDHEEGVLESPEVNITGTDGNWLAFPKGSTNRNWLENSSSYLEVLKCRAWSWYESTGLITDVTVRLNYRTFELHKFPLMSRSGYFKRELMEADEICLPETFPGGVETFELVAAYCYGATLVMDSSNIASLRCAADFCEMTEDQCRGNLCKRSEHYFNAVILKSWEDAIEVLRNCKFLHPLADEMLIVSSCVEAVSRMAIAKRFDGQQEKFPSNGGSPAEGSEDWWIHDLLTLPFDYFGQVIACIRRLGMEEKLIGRALLFYVDRWIFDLFKASDDLHDKSLEFEELEAFSTNEKRGVIESIVRLLPGKKDVMPVSFLFTILRCALAWNASLECRVQLEIRIAAQLEQATLTDFLLPLKTDGDQLYASRSEIGSMQRIVSHFYSQHNVHAEDMNSAHNLDGEIGICSISQSSFANPCIYMVSKVWDEYLTEIAIDPRLSPSVFLYLIQTVPAFGRSSHDQLYNAIHIYLKMHPHIPDQLRLNICKTLNCQKLSKDICIHAVQNDLMPLRMIVQAMFMHQLKARQATDTANNYPCRRSNRAFETDHLDKNLSPANFDQEMDGRKERSGISLGDILKRDAVFRQANCLKADFNETSFRLKQLEEEITSLRASLRSSAYSDEDDHHHNDSTQKFCSEAQASKKAVRSTNKGCGSGMAHKFVKSFHKLSLKKEVEDVADDLDLVKAGRHRRNRSASEKLFFCSSCADRRDQLKRIAVLPSDSKDVRRSHRRSDTFSNSEIWSE